METLLSALKQNNLTISSCESFTAGSFASQIGCIPGASTCFKGSLVCYQTSMKVKLLEISQDVVLQYGVVSREVAYLMCQNGTKLFDSDICVSFTGNAGPTAMENKPVGLIYIGINFCGDIEVLECFLSGDRLSIIRQAVEIAKNNLITKLVKCK